MLKKWFLCSVLGRGWKEEKRCSVDIHKYSTRRGRFLSDAVLIIQVNEYTGNRRAFTVDVDGYDPIPLSYAESVFDE